MEDFIRFAMDAGVLKFGEFTLKSGRVSPYFFNAGLFNDGQSLAQLDDFYADALKASGLPCDVLFGPAYKGIPLVSATAVAMARRHNTNLPWAFNRKEAKDHGEGGTLVGAEVKGNVVIVDDVITAGTAIREAVSLLQGEGVNVSGVLVAIDRQERGAGDLSAIGEVEQEYGFSVTSIVKLNDIVSFLEAEPGMEESVEAMKAYRRDYGISE